MSVLSLLLMHCFSSTSQSLKALTDLVVGNYGVSGCYLLVSHSCNLPVILNQNVAEEAKVENL